MSTGVDRIAAALEDARAQERAALVGFLTGGYPNRGEFAAAFARVAEFCDVVEVGVPFSDPMADGLTIQRASEQALADGTSLTWILEAVQDVARHTPVVLMSYLNPVLQMGYERFARASREAGVCGMIVPDLPFEECAPLRAPMDAEGLALVQLVTPETPPERQRMLTRESRGFVYAVTMTGITGSDVSMEDGVAPYLAGVRSASPLPVLAGFGIRAPEDVARLRPHVDGVIVGSAILESVGRGEDPGVLLEQLRGATHA